MLNPVPVLSLPLAQMLCIRLLHMPGADPEICEGGGTPLLPLSAHAQGGGARSLTPYYADLAPLAGAVLDCKGLRASNTAWSAQQLRARYMHDVICGSPKGGGGATAPHAPPPPLDPPPVCLPSNYVQCHTTKYSLQCSLL